MGKDKGKGRWSAWRSHGERSQELWRERAFVQAEHEKLGVYALAITTVRGLDAVRLGIPAGRRDLRDQLARAPQAWS